MARYYQGADGERYFYASEATIRCPLSPFKPDGLALQSYEEHLEEKAGELLDHLEAVGLDPVTLLRLAHRRSGSEGGRAGEPCPFCGTTLRSIGYAAWRERPLDAGGSAGLREVSIEAQLRDGEHRIMRPFTDGPDWARTDATYWPKKKEAIEWAREEARISKSVAREEVAR